MDKPLNEVYKVGDIVHAKGFQNKLTRYKVKSVTRNQMKIVPVRNTKGFARTIRRAKLEDIFSTPREYWVFEKLRLSRINADLSEQINHNANRIIELENWIYGQDEHGQKIVPPKPE